MIVELGHFALILAFCVAAVQCVLPLIGAQRRDGALMAVAGPAAVVRPFAGRVKAVARLRLVDVRHGLIAERVGEVGPCRQHHEPGGLGGLGS